MTDTETALLNVIADQPDEDTPRLVYADYLDELGDPSSAARAEFIRLHTRAARLAPGSAEREPLDDRIDQLLCAWDVAWQWELPAGFKRLCGYRRGFAHRAAVNATTVVDAADDPRLLFIECLEFTPDVPPARLPAALAHPLFSRLTELIVRGVPSWMGTPVCAHLGPDGTRALARGEYPRLERLALAGAMLGYAGLGALGKSDGFPRLRVLDISSNRLAFNWLVAFHRTPLCANLRSLNDGGNDPRGS